MPAIRAWLRRLWGSFRGHPHDDAMEAELRAHLDLAAQELQRRGLPSDEAARIARLEAGAVAQAVERMRDQRGLPWLADLAQDLRYGVRTLRRSPGLTAVALVTLTLAIGANTAIFSLVDPLLFRDLPVRDPGGLVQFSFLYPKDPPLNMFGLADYEHYRDHNSVFTGTAGLTTLTSESRDGGEPTAGEIVTGNFFQVLGVRSALGRLLDVSDDKAGAPPAAVVSWRYWRRHFNADPRVLGTPIAVEDARLPVPMHATIVGVAAREFTGLGIGHQPDVWMSLAAVPDAVRPRASLSLFARLRPGVSIDRARAEIRVLSRPWIERLAQNDPTWWHVPIDVKPARAGLSTPLHDQFGGPLLLLLTMVGGLLLLACANIGTLLLARGAARRHEMAVRVSLGAGRLRIVRQVLTESLLLAGAGSVLGLALARFGAPLLMRMIEAGTRVPGPVPHVTVALDLRVLLFTIAVTVSAAVVFGLAPALTAFVGSPLPALRERGGGTQPRSRRLFGNALVVTQVALSLALVSVSQVYVTHLGRLRDRSLGFDRDAVLLVSVDPARSGRSREELRALYGTAVTRLRAIPGVRSVALSGMTPISGAAGSRFVRVEGYQEPQENRRRVPLNDVSPDYFATLGTPLVAGRDFRDSDAAHPRLVIVNQAMARQYFAGRDPVGQHVWFDADREPFEIVGVVGDAKYQDVRVAAPPTIYFYMSVFRGSPDVSLRTAVSPATIAPVARRVIAEVFGAAAVRRTKTLAEQVDASIVPERLLAALSGFFAAAGALLAAVGLYGLLGYTIARRTTEIGVRMALGATHADVIRLVLRNALALVSAGLVFGVPAAFWGERLAASTVQHLSPAGLAPIVIASVTSIGVALIAAWVPVRRALGVDPIRALRSE